MIQKKHRQRKKLVTVPDLIVYFDPTVAETVRTSVKNSLKMALIDIETDEKIKAFAARLPVEIEAATKKAMGDMWSEEVKKSLPVPRIAWDKTPIMAVRGEVLPSLEITQKSPIRSNRTFPPGRFLACFLSLFLWEAHLSGKGRVGCLSVSLQCPCRV